MNERSDFQMGMAPSIKESDFVDCLDKARLNDIPSSGAFFTWSKKRVDRFLEKKLERVLGTDLWLDSFPTAIVDFVPPDFSDHCAEVLRLVHVPQRKSNFKFINFLTKHRDFLATVRHHWLSTPIHGIQMYQLFGKLRALKSPLRSLNVNTYGGI